MLSASAFHHCVVQALRMVNCVIAAVTWSSVLTNHLRSAFFIPHFTLRITQFRILPIAHTARMVNSL